MFRVSYYAEQSASYFALQYTFKGYFTVIVLDYEVKGLSSHPVLITFVVVMAGCVFISLAQGQKKFLIALFATKEV